MNPGKEFETYFKQSMQKDGLWTFRVRDNAMSYTQIASTFTNENPYDFLCYRYPNLFCLELKHTKQSSISFEKDDKSGSTKMIKSHQIKGLLSASEYEGVYAGFILSFYSEKLNEERTFYLSIDNFMRFLSDTDKTSINVLDILKYGGIKIEQKLLRKHYKYNVLELLDKIVKE